MTKNLHFIFIPLLVVFNLSSAYAFDTRPTNEEKKTMKSMIIEPWNNAGFFKKRFPETFKEASGCKNYGCIDEKRPNLDYIANNGYDIDLYAAIMIAARPGGAEEHMEKLNNEMTMALNAGDEKKAQEIAKQQEQIMRENGR